MIALFNKLPNIFTSLKHLIRIFFADESTLIALPGMEASEIIIKLQPEIKSTNPYSTAKGGMALLYQIKEEKIKIQNIILTNLV